AARYPQPAPRPAALQVPRLDLELPHTGEQRVRVARVEGEVRAARVGIEEQHRLHVLPPSVVRYTPRSWAGPYARPSAHTSTTSGFAGWITMRAIRPVASSPWCCQLRPPSVER